MERENQRVLLTKRLIEDSLLRLLEERTLYDISVRTLCEHAGVNRSTFYKHYGSQYELLGVMEADFLRRIQAMLDAAVTATQGDAHQQVTAVAAYLADNERLARMLLNNNVDPDFSAKLFALPSVRALLDDALAGCADARTRQGVISFIIHGGYALLQAWINSDDRQRPEEIATLVLTLARRVCAGM